MSTDLQLVLLPGLGATPALFELQRTVFPNAITPNWPELAPKDTLASYATKFAPRVTDPGNTVLAGVSFGGMLALELAALVRPKAVVLIGSCRSPKAIASHLRLAALAGRFVSAKRLESMRKLAPGVVKQLGPMTGAQANALIRMSEDVPMSFIRWAGRAIFAWPGRTDPGVPVHVIHGSADRIILPDRVGPYSAIAGAGHVPSFTHADEVNKLLAEILEKERGTRPQP